MVDEGNGGAREGTGGAVREKEPAVRWWKRPRVFCVFLFSNHERLKIEEKKL
jgi:hypothetical protein